MNRNERQKLSILRCPLSTESCYISLTGDNLNILRDYIKDESVDLIYLDPPFNSNRNFNVLFKNESGSESESQITAFEDTWRWNLQAEQTYKYTNRTKYVRKKKYRSHPAGFRESSKT